MSNFRLLFLASAFGVAACSGDSGNTISSSTGNNAPVFSSASSASIAENSTGVVYSAAATDADGDTISFSLSGGADQARFSITGAGALSFTAPPDFENPADADGNNIYLVTIRASDGTATTDLSLQVTVTDANEVFVVRRVASGLAAPLFLIGRGPGTSDVFITERAGVIRILDPDTGAVASTPFLDISTSVGTVGEGGLLGMALAPDYATSRAFYVHVTNTSGNTEIRRYLRSATNPNQATLSSGNVILTVAQPASNHNGGWIGFGADNMLYIALGDGGGSGDPFNNGQNPNTLLGAMLRIDPSSDAFPGDPNRDYAIPSGNPFAGSGGAPEVWAYGLRNPYRASVDRTTGNVYIGDVGQGALEEIDLAPAGIAGLNFGWPVREGTQSFSGPNNTGFTPPIAEYARGTGPLQGNSVTGGYVYRGPIAALNGLYFFADFVSNNIWSIPTASISQGTTIAANAFTSQTSAFTPNAGSMNSIVSFGEDAAGNLYVLSIGGDIFRVEPAP